MNTSSGNDVNRCFKNKLCRIKKFGRRHIDPIPEDSSDISAEVKKPVNVSLVFLKLLEYTHINTSIGTHVYIRMYIN